MRSEPGSAGTPGTPPARATPASSPHGQEGAGANGICQKVLATNIPRAPEISLFSAHAAPRPRRERSPPQPGQGSQLPARGLSSSPPAPADTPLPSLTLVDDLELLLLSPHAPPSKP